jgi:hypothetical protein
MFHEVRRIHIARIGIWVGVGDALIDRAVIEDNDLVDRKDG